MKPLQPENLRIGQPQLGDQLQLDWNPLGTLTFGRRRRGRVVRIQLIEVDDDSGVSPLDDEVGVDLHGEVAVVDLQDLEVVEADRHVHRTDDLAVVAGVDWGNVSETNKYTHYYGHFIDNLEISVSL